MIIYFTQEFDGVVADKFNFLASYDEPLMTFFKQKHYGDNLDVLLIGLYCMSEKYDAFFKPRKPNYQRTSSIYIHRGVQVERDGKSLTYEIRLNFREYSQSDAIKPLLARDVLNSLNIITSVKKIGDFDLVSFRSDLETFFKLNGWLS